MVQVLGETQLRERVLIGLQDFCVTFSELKSERRQLDIVANGVSFPEYVGLMSEAVLWQVKAVAMGQNKVTCNKTHTHTHTHSHTYRTTTSFT